MGTLWQDLRFGLRQLAREKGFAAAALLTLALVIDAEVTKTILDRLAANCLPARRATAVDPMAVLRLS